MAESEQIKKEIKIGNKVIKLPVDVNYTLTLPNKVLFLLSWGSSKKSIYNINRNIWCFNKQTGVKLWEIEASTMTKNMLGGDTYVGWTIWERREGEELFLNKDEDKEFKNIL